MAATLAATALVRAGAALAKAERDRRGRAQRERERQFGLLPAEGPGEGLRRIALGQLDLVLELLEGELDRTSAARTVHETRKALKRLRALVSLLKDELPEGEFEREDAILRDAGRRLAGARDGEVMVATLERLLKRHPRKLGRRRSLATLRERLAAERDRAAVSTLLGDSSARRELIGEVHALRSRVLQWRLADRPGMAVAEPGLRRIYRQGRRRYRRAARAGGDRTLAMHEWRKRVKDLRHAAEMLDRSGSGGEHARHGRRGGGGRRRARRRKEAARIHRLARRADALGEVLGEDHDLAVFAERVRSDSALVLGRPARRTLLRLIARRRRQLRRRALQQGERIYRRRPKAFVALVRDAYARAARGSRSTS
ncbi:MAG TPA: CHAD domain-containing protein [Solirubrobacteraceae bacterium]|nr:CHAD domain-containing protein [Solirubrobacteraceae bacterium]